MVNWWFGAQWFGILVVLYPYVTIPFIRGSQESKSKTQNHQLTIGWLSNDPLKTHISPENWWLEDEISLLTGPFSGDMHIFWGWNPVNTGINHQPQLVITGFQSPTRHLDQILIDGFWRSNLPMVFQAPPRMLSWKLMSNSPGGCLRFQPSTVSCINVSIFE